MYTAISLLLRRWPGCYSTEAFTRREGVMQENSYTAFICLFSWICSSIHVFTGCLDEHNVNFKVSSTCFNVDKKPWEEVGGSSVMKPEKRTKPCESFRC